MCASFEPSGMKNREGTTEKGDMMAILEGAGLELLLFGCMWGILAGEWPIPLRRQET